MELFKYLESRYTTVAFNEKNRDPGSPNFSLPLQAEGLAAQKLIVWVRNFYTYTAIPRLFFAWLLVKFHLKKAPKNALEQINDMAAKGKADAEAREAAKKTVEVALEEVDIDAASKVTQ